MPGTCVVGVFPPGVVDRSASAPLTFSPPIVPAPSRGLVDGATVAVTAGGVPAGDWAVRQCTTAFVDPTDAAADARAVTPSP